MNSTSRPGTRCWIALSLSGVACITSCSNAVDDAETYDSQHEPLYVASGRLWPQRDIPVCWFFSGSSTEKTWVKDALEGQHSWEAAANVNFTGWGTCSGSGTGIGIELDPHNARSGVGAPFSGRQSVFLDFSSDVHDFYVACNRHDLNRERCIKSVALHEFGHALGFAHEHNRPEPATCNAAPQGPNGDVTFGVWDEFSIMNYCNAEPDLSGIDRRGAERFYGSPYGDARRLHDYNADGRADLLCHNVVNGESFLDYADSAGHYAATDHTPPAYCSNDASRLFVADFDGNQREDRLCVNVVTGKRTIDYATLDGLFGGIDWTASSPGWCNGANDRLYVGDFNGDHHADLLCHDFVNGHLAIDYASAGGTFAGTDWERDADGFCWGNGAFGLSGRVFIGKFNADNRDDILCHELSTGQEWIDFADTSGHFMGADFSTATGFCSLTSSELHVGDFDADGLSDLLCHDVHTGFKAIDFGNDGYFGTDWQRDARWCGFQFNTARLFTGDVNKDGRDDLVCLDIANGKKWIDYAFPGENFVGTDWSISNGWCFYEPFELH
jgi:hypothetical protein